MNIIFLLAFMAFIGVIYLSVKHSNQVKQRAEFIDGFKFPEKLTTSIAEAYPHLSTAQTNRVIETLREYFHVCNEGGRDFMSMPSDAVDSAWHEFILFTRQYADFCDKAFGRFLHHTPAEGMSKPTLAQTGIRNTWRIACSRANINPQKPSTLPMLFGIDAMFKIENGYSYSLNCAGLAANEGKNGTHCVSHILASSSGCGGSSGGTSNSNASDAGCGSGCGGGCGG